MSYIIPFIILITIVVFIHEYGHYYFAKRYGVGVTDFSIGFGKELFGWNDKTGTRWKICLIPLGGYVSMITNKLIELEPEVRDQLTEEQIQNTFDSKPKWQRASIMFAGPLANFILSIFIFTLIFLNTPDPQSVPVISNLNQDVKNYTSTSSFEIADQILEINDVVVKDAKDVNLELLSYAGYTGPLNIKIHRELSEEPLDVEIFVEDFLPTPESQNEPLDYLGIGIDYKMQPYIGGVINGGAAEKGMLQANDKIISIADKEVRYAEDIRYIVSNNPNANLVFKVERGAEMLYLPITIGSVTRDGQESGVLGVSFGTTRSLLQSLNKGVYETYNLSIKTLQFIGKMLSGNMGTDNLSGPIGIAQMAGNTAQAGFLPFMYLMALLSISLAVINLLPIPVLDGGHLLMFAIEAIRRRPPSMRIREITNMIGMVILLLLMVLVFSNDIMRFIIG